MIQVCRALLLAGGGRDSSAVRPINRQSWSAADHHPRRRLSRVRPHRPWRNGVLQL